MKSRSDLLLLLASVLFSIALLESGLRIFTPYPVNLSSNRIAHPILGHVMDPAMDGIDGRGFRNPARDGVDVVTIGDSHTYGYNVSWEESWPVRFEKLSGKRVYNFGVGGYGVLQYHHLVGEAIELEPEAILIGLYPSNDLNVCRIGGLKHWRSQGDLLAGAEEACAGLEASERPQRPERRHRWLEFKSAIVSLARDLIASSEARMRLHGDYEEDYVRIESGSRKSLIKKKRIATHQKNMDVSRPEVEFGVQVLRRFLAAAKRRTDRHGIRLAVLLIPSRERMSFEFWDGSDDDVLPDYRSLVETEVALHARIEGMLEELEIDHIHAAPEVRGALESGAPVYPLEDDGHPLAPGYEAYARSALQLFAR